MVCTVTQFAWVPASVISSATTPTAYAASGFALAMKRKHLKTTLTALLSEHPTAELWHINGVTEDSPDVRTSAQVAVRGMKKVLKNPRLVKRVIASFSSLEIITGRGRKDPSVHVHTLIVTRQISKGKYRIPRKEWIAIWENACPLARKPLPKPKRTRKGPKKKPHDSFKAVQHKLPMTTDKAIHYVTYYATLRHATEDYRALLNAPDDAFMKRQSALKGVTRFFGAMHRRPKRKPKPFGLPAVKG
jgi:hypothetical protein